MFISCRFTIAVLHLSVTRMHSSYHPDEVFAICYPDSLLLSISERNSLLSLVILGLVPWRKKKWNLWSKFILCSPECSGSKSTRAQRFIPTICNPNSALKYMFKWAQKNIYRSQIYNNIIKPYMRVPIGSFLSLHLHLFNYSLQQHFILFKKNAFIQSDYIRLVHRNETQKRKRTKIFK